MSSINVNYKDLEIKTYNPNTSFLEISKDFRKYYNYPILIAKVDNHITYLNEVVTRDCKISFYDRSSNVGNSVYENTVHFMMIVAIKKLLGLDAEVVIEHSMDNGVYCELINRDVDIDIIRKIEAKMHELTADDLAITKVNVSRIDAMQYFMRKKQFDKVKVLKYISNTFINLYRLDNIYDYFYGELAPRTKVIDEFRLTYIRGNGFILSYPNTTNPECTLDYVHHRRLFDTFLDYTKWGRILDVQNAADLNEYVSTGAYDELIRISEAYYDGQLANVADEIYDNKENIKLVLIAGPTSSGKTTTSKKLEVYLRSKGILTHQISIDDYFFDRQETSRDQNGDVDYESLRAIDVNAFNKDLSRLLLGERVLLPEYNFVAGKREYKKKWLQLKTKNDIIIIEGLHGLNEELTMSIERRYKYKIFLSPLTQLNIDNHSRIHTSDTRILRRIVRDNRFRGYSATDTIKQWKKVRKGEHKYIYPYQDEADAIINSALTYELGVLKTYAEPLLFSVDEAEDIYPEALRLINFLRNFLPIPSEEVPNDSVLREFIGNSCFRK